MTTAIVLLQWHASHIESLGRNLITLELLKRRRWRCLMYALTLIDFDSFIVTLCTVAAPERYTRTYLYTMCIVICALAHSTLESDLIVAHSSDVCRCSFDC